MLEGNKVLTNFPKISVIIPAYNEEKYIASAIECFLKQVYYPLEIIVVDDGSTDKTPEIASRFPIKLIRIKHSGPAKAKNVGIEAASGELIVIHDANDIILDDNFLTKISTTYISSGKRADIILMPIVLLPRRRGLINKAMFIRDYLKFRPKIENGTPVVKLLHTAAFKSEFLKYHAKYKEDLGAHEDTFFLEKREPKKVISSFTSTRAIGGAMDSLRQMISRWIWYGKSLIPIWRYSKKLFILKVIYGIYTTSFIIALMLFPIVNALSSLFYIPFIPFLIVALYRTVKAYFYTRDFTSSLLLPFLDLLQGLCFFVGLLKALILLVLKRYTPAK
jgi:glycosyltransferase involved in cell wall biosynthesis